MAKFVYRAVQSCLRLVSSMHKSYYQSERSTSEARTGCSDSKTASSSSTATQHDPYGETEVLTRSTFRLDCEEIPCSGLNEVPDDERQVRPPAYFLKSYRYDQLV